MMNYSENTKPRGKLRVNIRPILKYLGLFFLGFIMFKVAAIYARIDRGYSAIGGEALFLFLPVFYYLISKTVRDWLDYLKDEKL